MLAVYGIITGVCFAAAVIGWSLAYAGQKIHTAEMAAYMKVGKWHQDRVAELENENRQLATQVVASGGLAHHAMPLPGPNPYVEYAYDDTGLVREALDPRDLPSHL